MATVTPVRPQRNLAESHRRVRHPLQRLRVFIRLYIVIECVLLLLLFLTAWFWIGLLVDFGLYKVSTWILPNYAPLDLAERSPWLFKGLEVVLALCVVALVAWKVGIRLTREFREDALALLLERRFPQLLGDRLITAVELADPRKAVPYGYSTAMIEKTIHDAAERVDQLPILQVFNWRRLIWHGVCVVALSFGLYVVLGGLLCLTAAFENRSPEASALAGYGRLEETSHIWMERNLLLQETPWPRHASIEIREYPTTVQQVGNDPGTAKVKVRLHRWMIADPQARYGYRPLRWDDLNKDLLDGEDVPALPLHWVALGFEDRTVDEVELRINNLFAIEDTIHSYLEDKDDPEQAVHNKSWEDIQAADEDVPNLPADWGDKASSWKLERIRSVLANQEEIDKLEDLRNRFFKRLNAAVDGFRANRRLRKMDLPGKVLVQSWTEDGKPEETPMKVTSGYDYEAEVSLLDSITFRVHAGDYFTPEHKIKLEPPPPPLGLENFACDLEKPAYIYYRLSGRDPKPLAGVRQLFADQSLSTVAKEVNTLHVPAGTHVVLRGTATHPLKKAPEVMERPDLLQDEKDAEGGIHKAPEVAAVGGKDVPVKGAQASLDSGDSKQFSVRLSNVRAPQAFEIRLTDQKGATATHLVRIDPQRDKDPTVEMIIEPYIRKIGEDPGFTDYRGYYVISANGWIPLVGKAEDDRGLTSVEYVYTITELETKSSQSLDASFTASLIFQLADNPMLAYPQVFMTTQPKRGKTVGDGRFVVTQFQNTLRKRLGAPIALAQLQQRTGAREQPRRGWSMLADMTGISPWLLNYYLDGPYLIRDNYPDVIKSQEDAGQPRDVVKAILQEIEAGRGPGVVPDKFMLDTEQPSDTHIQSGIDLAGSQLRLNRPLVRSSEDAKLVQPFYRMELAVEAADSDVESDTVHGEVKRGENKERFLILIVPEADLLALVAREEESLHEDMQKNVLEDLVINQGKLQQMIVELRSRTLTNDQYIGMADRTLKLLEALDKELSGTQKVSEDVIRIVKELQANRVQQSMLERVDAINKGLKKVLAARTAAEEQSNTQARKNAGSAAVGDAENFKITHPNFVDARQAVAELKASLDDDDPSHKDSKAQTARENAERASHELRDLKAELDDVLGGMQGLIEYNKVRAKGQKIRDDEMAQALLMDELYKRVRDIRLKDLEIPDLPK